MIEVPAYLQPLNETLSLVELIRVVNTDRALQFAESQSGQSLTWGTLADSMKRARLGSQAPENPI